MYDMIESHKRNNEKLIKMNGNTPNTDNETSSDITALLDINQINTIEKLIGYTFKNKIYLIKTRKERENNRLKAPKHPVYDAENDNNHF